MSSALSPEIAGGSGQSSPGSSRSKSPMAFDFSALDSSDPLQYLLSSAAAAADSLSASESSTDDSYRSTATPPSSHDSPSTDWATAPATLKEATMDWQQPDFSLATSFDDFNSAMNLDDLNLSSFGLPLQFDPNFFVTDASGTQDLLSSATALPNLSSYSFSFNPDNYGELQPPSSTTGSRRLSVTSSSSSSGASFSPIIEHTQATSPSPHSPAPASAASAPTFSQQVFIPTGEPQLSGDRQIDELAEFARQTAGVTLALPVSMDMSSSGQHGQPSKLPIPRLQRPVLMQTASTNGKRKMITSDSPSQTQVFSRESTSPLSSTPAPIPTRTKTSHTTIERRYRTKVNARIQSLRAAVPALRVLEQRPGNRVGNLALKAGTKRIGVDVEPGAEEEDVIDERGFVDGVKVARKGSKANVLGKAVEYIQVLKRRELRLKREQEGLKTLVRSLVGGPALLREWETAWREKFGGPEKDEVEGEDGEADDENEEGDEDEDDEDGEDEEGTGGKKRKRPKVESGGKGKGKKTAPPKVPLPIVQAQSFTMVTGQEAASATAPGVQPEKRKRGRPRKVPLLQTAPDMTLSSAQDVLSAAQQPMIMVSAPMTGTTMEIDPTQTQRGVPTTQMDGTHQQPQTEQLAPQHAQPGQYLLAAFAFFSFFNSPVSFYASSTWRQASPVHTHEGSVLGAQQEVSGALSPVVAFGWRDAVHLIHLTVSVLLLFSIVLPWLPRIFQTRVSRFIPGVLNPVFGLQNIAASGSDDVRNTRARKFARSSSRGNLSDDDGTSEEEKADASARTLLLAALRRGGVIAPVDEAQVLRDVLGLGSGIIGLLTSVGRLAASTRKGRSKFGLERRMLEQKALCRLAELVALDANASIAERLQTYLYSFKFLSIFSASASDLATLALIVQPFWHAKSVSLWDLALNRSQGKGSLRPQVCRPYESFILETLTVDEAAERLANLDFAHLDNTSLATYTNPAGSTSDSEDDESGHDDPVGPLAILASRAVYDHIREKAEIAFLQTVSGESIHVYSDADGGEQEMQRIVAAGRSLGSRTSNLVSLFERVCGPASSLFANVLSLDQLVDLDEQIGGTRETEESQIHALLCAVIVYRQIFPSTLLSSSTRFAEGSKGSSASGSSIYPSISISLTPMPSPPPSPSRRNAALEVSLRRYLYSTAFNRADELEDARDRAVDMLTSQAAGWSKRLQY